MVAGSAAALRTKDPAAVGRHTAPHCGLERKTDG